MLFRSNDTATTEIYTGWYALSLHDALPISLAPNVEALHFFLGRLYRKTDHKEEAAREFAEAARIAGTQTDASVPNLEVPE